jgi:RHS repeat-associated protein
MTLGDSEFASGFSATSPSIPIPTLPKGGGAIRGIGEKFAANAVTGTGSTSVPLATSPGRSGFGPHLSLSYDSGSGNGPFGFGWTLSTPAISRKTDKGLPRYRDAEESDAYLLSGAEDLVPVFAVDQDGHTVRGADGKPLFDERKDTGYLVRRYRPRIEGLFARIESWTRQSDGDIHWRSISRENVLTVYGRDAGSRIADPTNPGRIFTWLICETRDDKGNAVLYGYKPEDGAGVDLTRAHERNRGLRDDVRRTANRYLKRIRYGNRVPLLDSAGQRPRELTAAQIEDAGWMFEVVFDYGEHDTEAPKPDAAGTWAYRDDPFSSYRAGFEVRIGRLCQRVLMFHHFPAEPDVGDDCLVRSTDFTYFHERQPADAHSPVYASLSAVTQAGYRRQDGGYLKRSLPAVEFEYTRPVVQDTIEEVDAASLENLPIGVDGALYQWTDLHGEGIPGILTEQAGAWFYRRNLSPISEKKVEFAPVELVAARPNLDLGDGRAQFLDLAGDGLPDLVVLDGPMPGFYEHDDEEGWQPFRPFTSRLNRDTRDPDLKLIDLDGDGHVDVLISEDDAFVWHTSLAEEGFGPARRVPQAHDEEKGPRLVFADREQSVHLADLSGDGLTDLVRIRNGEVCYWPNLGHGRFGAKVTMDQAPWFDHPDRFDPKRLRLADIDGTGTTDIMYLHRDGVRLYFNQSGNRWSAPQTLRQSPRVDDLAAVVTVDLLGNGTACLVWSSSLPADARRPMRYVDLMGSEKPHLLVRTINNLGVETRVTYASSTKFYLQDKRRGRPWITRLPFPVHVVERVERRDSISGNRFVTCYAYHHGYFDGEERELRGFGMVEQWDTEEFAAPAGDGTSAEAADVGLASHVPPVYTRTWFHTGVHLGRDHVSDFFAGFLDGQGRGEYYREPAWRNNDVEARKHLLDDTVLPPGLTPEEEREACRALKGAMLRQEVYALDGTGSLEYPHGHPYVVTEQSFALRCLQPREDNRHAVFFSHTREALTSHYERHPTDPRVSHALTLEVDSYGNVQRELAIGYGRRAAATDPALTDADKARQTRLLITYSRHRHTNAVLSADHYRTPLPAETQTYELTGFEPENSASRFSYEEWTRGGLALLTAAAEIPYHQTADHVAKQKRLIEHIRTRYRKDDLSALSPLGTVEPMALPGEGYTLALTPDLLAHVFRRTRTGQPDEELLPAPATLLEGKGADQGGYFAMDGHWWIPSSRTFFDPGTDSADPALTAAQERSTARQHFYLPRKIVDPFGHATLADYDPYDLLLARTSDALGNVTAAINDYRVLQPRLVTDPNRNRTAIAFDALGLGVATAVMGKEGQDLGDLLEDFDADPPLADLQAFLADPRSRASSLLGKATRRIVYDRARFERAGQPPVAATLARETHFHDSGGAQSQIQISFSYSDGFEREIQRKIQAEAGDAPQRQPPVPLPAGDIGPGDLVRDTQGRLVQASVLRRWVGSGRTVFNNKGKPVRQYEPFFSATHLYEPEREMTDAGVSPVLFYDPLSRLVAKLHPNQTYEKVVFDPWRQKTYDVNDTVAARGMETGDPRTDPDIAAIVREYFKTQPATWQTWHAQRIAHPMGTAEHDAAEKAAAHADTPAVAYLDTLGRPFLTLAHNRYQRHGTDVEEVEEKNAARAELDIEGNQLAVGDARDRVVMRYDYDLRGNRLHQASMEAGERWTLNDAAGKPIRAWDSRKFLRRMTYDELRRPAGLFVTENGVERLAELTRYGESEGDAGNHRSRVHQVFDGAGIVTSVAYDFKGNRLESRRELLADYRQEVDWLTGPAASGGSFTSETTFDALDRPLTATSPDGSIYRPTFNEANLLEKVDIELRGTAVITSFVTNIDYDAKGQRRRIAYGNGAQATYEYDPLTFRLTSLRTTRPASLDAAASQLFRDAAVVQDLRYTYDPAGNLTRIEDAALETVIHGGQRVEPVSRYTYDAIYRLIEAQGREHIGQTVFDFSAPGGDARDYPFVGHRANPNDLQALRNFTQSYEYDAAGNFTALRHLADGGNWTRGYEYEEESLLEAGKQSNRLTRTKVGNGINRTEPYTHDAHGNMTAMPHLAMLAWNFEGRLRQVDLGGGGTAYYVYDAAGRRVRKVIDDQSGARRKERIDLGGFEVCREYNGGAVTQERETLRVMDDQQCIALVETRTTENGNPVAPPVSLRRYQLGNHLGSVSVELDEDGALISYEEYHPYGTTAFQAGRSAAEVSLKRYRYTRKERDEETGLAYHGLRYYASWLGRWISCDPAGLVDGINLYRYVRGNPLKHVDPTGMQCDPTMQSCIDPTVSVERKEALQPTASILQPTPVARPQSQRADTRLSAGGTAGIKGDGYNDHERVSALRIWSPIPDSAVRKTNPLVDPSPTKLGLSASNPSAVLRPAEHALAEHLVSTNTNGSPFISASMHPKGASRIEGNIRLWIDIDKAKSLGSEFISEKALSADMEALARSDSRFQARAEMWRIAAEREVLFRGTIDPRTVDTATMRYLRYGGRGLQVAAVGLTTYDLGQATLESVRAESPMPVAAETIRQVGSWGAAWAGAKVGARLGAAVGMATGLGAVLSGLGGAVVFGAFGYFGADLIADYIYAN